MQNKTIPFPLKEVTVPTVAAASVDDEHRQWLTRIQARDQTALKLLFDALSSSVHAFVNRLLHDEQAADDVVVDTMYDVWRNADTFEGKAQVKTWIMSIARFKALDVLRTRKRHVASDIELYEDTLEDTSASTLDMLIAKQQTEWVLACMENLPLEQRESLYLMFYENMSVVDIATLQGCQENTVKTRIFHAKRKLKHCVAGWLAQ